MTKWDEEKLCTRQVLADIILGGCSDDEDRWMLIQLPDGEFRTAFGNTKEGLFFTIPTSVEIK